MGFGVWAVKNGVRRRVRLAPRTAALPQQFFFLACLTRRAGLGNTPFLAAPSAIEFSINLSQSQH